MNTNPLGAGHAAAHKHKPRTRHLPQKRILKSKAKKKQ